MLILSDDPNLLFKTTGVLAPFNKFFCFTQKITIDSVTYDSNVMQTVFIW